ncbi:carbohydrate-binding protein [Streptomyces tsukubensis]|uniref:Carbohydrate-binding protein n=1 Tax=Streptomyces tsukubensis TaxID=83656 RepID=A0A1V4A7U7_9ACTN|nr:carbohydrate-binding protein [Streptomyces tsukubensis]OON78756.1 carbohydrate-binding protein [Streptomyces tsukubensis]QFR94233.1 carbohydrate-binding protein [Streptomyces tsukubensis]
MTPGNNGASPPEDDDPFGYLYADGQAAGATPPSGGGYGYPGPRSYNQVRTVGERQYGQQGQQGQYGQQQQYGQQGQQQYGQQPTQAYGQPNPHYAAPEVQPGGAPPSGGRQGGAGQGGGGRGRGPNTKALLIGAIAVVAAVAIGIGVALATGDTDDKKDEATDSKPSRNSQPSESAQDKPSTDPKPSTGPLPESDAKALKLDGGTVTASDVSGAKASGGTYVAGFNKVGAKITWTVNGIPKDGSYSLRVIYGVPGKDADATVTVNGKAQTRPLSLKNFAGAKEGDWEKGWTNSWGVVQLSKGTNNIVVSCEEGNKCDANFDQFSLVNGTNG